MKKQIISTILILFMVLSMMPETAMAAGNTKTISLGMFKLEISDVYASHYTTKVSGDGHTTMHFVVVPNGAKIKILEGEHDSEYYNFWPFNDIKFPEGIKGFIDVEQACDYDDSLYLKMEKGTTLTAVKNNEYYFSDGITKGQYNDQFNFGVRIFVVDEETLVQFGGPKPSKKEPEYVGKVTAKPSNTNFVVTGKGRNTVMDAPLMVTQVYNINQTNYLQLRAIATLLNRTSAQFDVSWDGQYAVIEPGKPFTGTVTGSKMKETKNVRDSVTKFKMNGEVFSFSDAKLINGSTNYIQLREFAQKLSGTASQFNVYWDSALGQAIIQPGAPYVGTRYEPAVTVLEEFKTDEEILPDGKYYLKIFDKYVYPVSTNLYWIELHDKRPDETYDIKLVENDKEKGPKFTIQYGGKYIGLSPFTGSEDQLQSVGSYVYPWRINKYSSFITIRDYANQALAVNASGASKANATKITVWSYKGSAPEHTKITLYKEAVSNGLKTTVRVAMYPTKTTYKVGEAFDITGLKSVLNEGGVEKDVNDKLKFYSGVELTQGRAFTTVGTKVVQIWYEGDKVAEYKIVVK